MVVLLQSQEGLRRVASRWGCAPGGLALPLPWDSLLALPCGLAPPHGLRAAWFILIFTDGGLCATHEGGVGDVRARAGWSLR